MKNILLAVSGLNPQVITEALYALHMEGRNIHSLHIITTVTGRENIFSSLLAPGGAFECFLREYEIPGHTIDFPPKNINVITDARGRELDDIVDAESNEALLKLCLDLAFELTSSPDNAVFFLVAGGRKTMSSCLTVAAQFYARPQDRVYHVLVSPEFESCRDFWFPPKKSVPVTLYDQKGQPYQKETRYAQIHLVSMPIVSVRGQLDARLLDRPRSPAELMTAIIKDEPRLLTISLPEAKIMYGKREMDVHPACLALYTWFAERKEACTLTSPCRDCTRCFVEAEKVLNASKRLTQIYRSIPGSRALGSLSDTGILSLTRENFNSYKSKLRKLMENTFGHSLAGDVVISSVGTRPDTRFGIFLDRSRIRIER